MNIVCDVYIFFISFFSVMIAKKTVVCCWQSEVRQVERTQSASVESIPEVLEDRDLLGDQSDAASVHDMDYVNPRGVRFTQSTQKEGTAWILFSADWSNW